MVISVGFDCEVFFLERKIFVKLSKEVFYMSVEGEFFVL